jgi:1-acyl-sn-glycerol-3-phosphate acyltransferase
MLDKLDYARRMVSKMVCYFFFGLGALLLGAFFYPLLSIFIRDEVALRRLSRRMVRLSFAAFVRLMQIFGLIRVEFENAEALRRSEGFIVAANHPSLIDVVILGSLVPHADCIVKRQLWGVPFVRSIVRRAYIPNGLEFDETARLCGSSLSEGNTLIVFPEGTRTRKDEVPRLRRGAARLAISTGHDILPVCIFSGDASGLRKGDPFFCLPERGPTVYLVRALEPIRVGEYARMEPALGARALTKHLTDVILTTLRRSPAYG